jgi:methylmalonyl-CoA decarboxylase
MNENSISNETTQPVVIARAEGYIGIITLNDPHKANCLSETLINLVLDALKSFQEQKLRAVVIRAYPGAKIFSAGHDLREIHADGSEPLGYNDLFEQLLRAVIKNPVPVIGMIEGSVWGGACDLAATFDILVGTPTSTFAITPAKLGIAYNIAGLNHFMGVLPAHVFREMLFTANPLSAEEAYRLGFLNHLVEAGKVEETAMEIALTIASRAPLDTRLLRMEMQKLTSGTSLKPDDYEEIQGIRKTVYKSKDFKEGVEAFFQKRTPEFKGE